MPSSHIGKISIHIRKAGEKTEKGKEEETGIKGPPGAQPEGPGRDKKMGFPERKLDGNPITSKSGGVLLSHTLSSAVPSPC